MQTLQPGFKKGISSNTLSKLSPSSDVATRKALELFNAAAVRVPAYKDFLKKAGINHSRIKTIADFASVPITDAKNYISAYPLEARSWDGNLSRAQFIATSSGTKGEPKFWPRDAEQDLEATYIHEFLYRTCFNVQKHSTLLLIGFPMGIYISGMATVLPSWLSAFKTDRMTIMSVGNHKAEILRAVRNLSHHYEQTVLVGHPFFIKDVLETGVCEGIGWAEKNLGMMFCSEGFTEAWRGYIAEIAGIPSGSMRIFNTYGSSEMLLMAYETAFTIGLKRRAEEKPGFLKTLTDNPVVPQFFQYHPALRYIESINKELVFTASSGIPLVRFNLRDRGDIFPLEQVECATGISAPKSTLRLPVVALWGRSDHTLKFHGVNIYPDHIKLALGDKRFLKRLTGKFTLRKILNKKMDQFFEVNIELAPDGRLSNLLRKAIQAQVIATLLRVNLEYKDMSVNVKKDVRPRIVLWPYQHPRYFKPGLKPRYLFKK